MKKTASVWDKLSSGSNESPAASPAPKKLRRNTPSAGRKNRYYSERFLRRRHAAPLSRQAAADSILGAELDTHIRDYLFAGRLSQQTEATLREKARILSKFQWFCERENYSEIGAAAVQAYLQHVNEGHLEPLGRFGQGAKYSRARNPCTPNTYRYHYDTVQALFKWLQGKQIVGETPFAHLDKPRCATHQVQPFSDAQIEALLRQARQSFSPRRDTAILWFLLDTGVRAAELCNLKNRDIDERACSAQIFGKGGKKRLVYFGTRTARALMQHTTEMASAFGADCLAAHAPLFPSDRGTNAGEHLTTTGLHQLIARLGKRARLSGVRCSPHTFRHTFALNFLRDGGNQSSLMRLLGHSSLAMTDHYCALAGADLEEQHRRHSPGDNMGRRRGR